MTQPIRRTSEIAAQNSELPEAKAILVRAYVEDQQQAPRASRLPQFPPSGSQGNELVIPALDDVKLYGAEAIAQENHTRQYDPYAAYKEMLGAVTSEASGAPSPQRPQPRSLVVSVAESV
jgi:hypothetical protein